MDAVKIYLLSDAGVRVQLPVQPLTPYSYCEESQASRRRSKLRWKRDCGTALKNKILFWVFFILICIIEFAGILVLGGMVASNFTLHKSVFVGILTAMVIILAWLATYSYLDDKIETDPNYLNLKR